MTITASTRTHLIVYSSLVAVLGLLLWLWHDTRIKDAAALKAITTDKAAQLQTAAQAVATEKAAQTELATKNAALQEQLKQAKTSAQQVALINSAAGTHLVIDTTSPTPGIIPSQPVVTLPTSDLPTLAKDTVDFQQLQNQIDADSDILKAKDAQLTADAKTISDQGQEITILKGGSHWQQFVKAAKHVGIGVVIGTAAGVAIDRKFN